MELLVDITAVKGTIEEQQTKSAGLEGVPERLKKQVLVPTFISRN